VTATARPDDGPVPVRPPTGPTGGVDEARVAAAVRELLDAIGEDIERQGLLDTPARVARLWTEVASGLHEDPRRHLRITFEADHDEMVMVRDIPMYSMCEHHLIPFVGQAHVAYIPNDDGRVIGLSKVARLVDGYARRPQVQERLTAQVADALSETLEPKGVMVVVEAEHLCMSMRGVRQAGTSTVTSAVRGLFRSSVATRQEAMRFITRGAR
jgi:GTP cyclohydrolase I